MLLQQVGTTGEIHDYTALISELKSRKIVVSVAADIMALVLLTAPGKQGADIVLVRRNASACRWATVAHTRHSLRRKMNTNAQCRAVLSVYRKMQLAIPRCAWRCRLASNISAVKANSNICTSVLLANIASLYAVYHGPVGLKRIANRIHRLTDITAAGLQQKV